MVRIGKILALALYQAQDTTEDVGTWGNSNVLPLLYIVNAFVHISLLLYSYMSEIHTLQQMRCTVGGVETKFEATDQSGFTKLFGLPIMRPVMSL